MRPLRKAANQANHRNARAWLAPACWSGGLVFAVACSGGGGSESSAPSSTANAVDTQAGAGAGAMVQASASTTGPREGVPAVRGAGARPAAVGGGPAPAADSGQAERPSNMQVAGSSAAAGAGVVAAVAGAGAAAAGAGAAAAGVGAAAAGSMAAAGSTAMDPNDASAEPASCTGTQTGKAPVIYVIGDSTAALYAQDKYPAMGWAQPLQEYFAPACATVQDKAINGRSSKSFYDEGAWTPIRSALRAGDYVLIQFGHNDEKREDAARFTEPFGSYQEQLAVYIDDTLAAQATPILLTSIERNKWSGDKLNSSHGDYPEAVRQLAQKRQVGLVDMTQLTHAYLERIGQNAATALYMHLEPGEYPAYPEGVTDDTHLQDKGAHAFADLALAELARQRAPIAVLLDHVPVP